MITARKLLGSLRKDRIVDIADKLGVNHANLSKKELISRLSRSLAHRVEGGERNGKAGACRIIADVMTRAECIEVLRWNDLFGAAGAYTTSAAIHKMSADAARTLVAEAATLESPEAVDDLCTSKKWAQYFWEMDGSENSDDDDGDGTDQDGESGEDDLVALESVEESEVAAVEDDEPEWLQRLSFQAGPGVSLPDGLVSSSGKLFEHQARSIARLSEWWEGGEDRGVLCLPTGAGKTRTAVHFAIERVVAARGRVLWLAHRHELVNQAVAAFLQNACLSPVPFRVARFEAGHRKYEEEADVVVASIPTLARAENVERLIGIHGGFSLIIVDECHHAVARTWRRLLLDLTEKIEGEKVLGLSATPTRTADHEARQLWRIFGRIIHEERPLPLMEQGILARPRVICVATGETYEAQPKERELFLKFKDLPLSLIQRIASDEKRNALIVEKLTRELDEWRSTLVFAATVDHAEELVDRIREKGVEADMLDASSSRDERLSVIERFRRGELKILVNVGLFTEGTDLPSVQTVFLARPTVSRILFQQMVGRGLRGPKLGGTPVCNVVSFHDSVRGLVQDQLTSSFKSESDALDAIAGEGQELAGVDEDELVLEELDDDAREHELEARRRMEELRAALRRIPEDGDADVSSLPLVGWWQAEADGQVEAIPVFEEEVGACGAFVGTILHEAYSGMSVEAEGDDEDESVDDELSVPRLQRRRFAEVLVSAPSSLAYFSVMGGDARAKLPSLRAALERKGAEGGEGRASPEKELPGHESPIWDLARWLIDPAREKKVLLVLDGQLKSISRADYAAVDAVWRQMGTLMLGATPTAEAVERFVTTVVGAPDRFPEMKDVSADLAKSLIAAAAGNGGQMPTPAPDESLKAPPELAALRQELARLSPDRRPEAVRAYHRAFFAMSQSEYAEFVTALVCA